MLFLNRASKKGICYYRHSKDDAQENSIEIQREQVEAFAEKNNVQILKAFEDEMTGVTDQRPGFQELMNDWVLNPDAPKFDCILVYDVSRWGRFLMENMASHYAYECEKRGIQIVFATLGFPPEGAGKFSMALVIQVLSWQASNYSKELSVKVFNGSKKVSQQGYSAGGVAPYGYTRWLCEEVNKQPIRPLQKGERKQIANDRVTFRPTGDHTTKTVQDIFYHFVTSNLLPEDIAETLNSKGIVAPSGAPWNRGKVLRILENLTYSGARVYNKSWHRLHQKSKTNPRAEWVITPNAHPAIIDQQTFDKAQDRLYWISSWWRKGIRAMRSTKEAVESEAIDWLARNGYSIFQAEDLMPKFPITYSVCMKEGSDRRWCFSIPESMRQYDNILAVSIDPDKAEMADKFLMLPIQNFNNDNFILLSEQDEDFKKYQVSKERLAEQILFLARQVSITWQESQPDGNFTPNFAAQGAH